MTPPTVNALKREMHRHILTTISTGDRSVNRDERPTAFPRYAKDREAQVPSNEAPILSRKNKLRTEVEVDAFHRLLRGRLSR